MKEILNSKILLFLPLVLITISAYSQRSEVVIDSVDSKAVIYSKTLIWITKNWKNSDEVIQLKDETSGTIILKGGLSSNPGSSAGLTTTQITFDIRDGKARMSFENTIHEWLNGSVYNTELHQAWGKRPMKNGRLKF